MRSHQHNRCIHQNDHTENTVCSEYSPNPSPPEHHDALSAPECECDDVRDDPFKNLGSGRRRWIMLLLSVFISVLTISLLLNLSFHDLLFAVTHINPIFFAIAVIVHLLALFIWSLRLKVLSDFVGNRRHARQRHAMRAEDNEMEVMKENERDKNNKDKKQRCLLMHDALKIVFASLFGACITPSQFGGEPIRIYLLSRRFLSVGDSTVVVFGERVFDFFVVMIGAIFSTLFLYLIAEPAIKPFLMVACAILTTIFGISSAVILISVRNTAKIKNALERILGAIEKHVTRMRGSDAMERFKERAHRELDNICSAISVIRDEGERVVITSFALSAALWTVDFCIPPLILLSLHADPAWIPSFAAQFLLLILVSIPLTPGSSGVAEIGFTYIYKIIGIHVGAIFTLLWRLIVYYMNLLLGIISSMIILREHARA